MQIPRWFILFALAFAALCLLHLPYIRLPYFWDEAGYYIPAAWDIYHRWDFVPTSTMPNGHTPLVMTCLAIVWHVFGCSPWVSRVVMMAFAAGTVSATYSVARRLLPREPSAWCAALLGLSPLFFAQSSLVFLDLPAALFTTLAVLSLLEQRGWRFALMASLAVLTKETAAVILPLAWLWMWRGQQKEAESGGLLARWLVLSLPALPLVVWTLYYHHQTGFWTGNAEYLEYNLRSTLDPARIGWTILRRLYEILVSGFNWVLVLGALAGAFGKRTIEPGNAGATRRWFWLASGLVALYVVVHSVVGGAILPRYLLPVFPVFFVMCGCWMWRLSPIATRGVGGVAAGCFVAAWFLNPPYPFAFENNLAYADFVRLHQEAAQDLESRHANSRIMTAWPATDEISRPFLGYVSRPLAVVPVEGFSESDFEKVAPDSFEVLYLYSRKWEPDDNWLERFPAFLRAQRRHFGYALQVSEEVLIHRYGLVLVKEWNRRGQWVRIYRKR
jgi:4-amino-4-deoxy-L-arabinose transferase-like glycosyltransferase